MAARKQVEEEIFEEEYEEPSVYESSPLTTVVETKDNSYKGPRVTIFLPALEDSGSAGIKVDQYEHVTIANEQREEHYRILRGQHVDVPIPVFMALKERYPNL
jgi:hypothetical protein